MHDLLVRDGKEIMYAMSNLNAYHDRQLPNVGCIAEESAGVEREPAKLFAKLLAVMNHFACTSFAISSNCHRSNDFKLGELEQGNSVLDAMCRDTSCIIFKKMENEKLGAITKCH